MGKISPVMAKYIVHTNISIEGVVDKPDIIGAIFGQTEGLLGSELELRDFLFFFKQKTAYEILA